jgi:hypothetical protein
LKNQKEIGSAIKPFYGDAAGDKLTVLLESHIKIATEIVDAALQGTAAKKEEASKRWTANAEEIAAMLNGANPNNWSLADLKHMLRSHLELTTQELTAHLNKDWAGSIAAYHKVHDQILVMADTLTTGLAKQFPQKTTAH